MVVLVEAELPWPKPVAKHEELRALVAAATAHPDRMRVLAAEPHDPGRSRLIAFRRTPTGMTRAEVVIGADPVGDLEAILEPGRPVPSIACEVPGGLPAKSTWEWRVLRLTPGQPRVDGTRGPNAGTPRSPCRPGSDS